MSVETRQKHELEVIDSVVRGGSDARPEDAELVDFALSMRAARPLPDHGAAMRIDDRVAKAGAERRDRKFPAWQLAAACACLILVAGVVAASRWGGADFEAVMNTNEVAKPMKGSASNSRAKAPELQDSVTQQFQRDSAAMVSGGQKLAPIARDPRKQERQATISLVTPPDKFDRAADRVNVIASEAGGYVQSSKTRVSDRDRTRGTFLLMVPVSEYREVMTKLARVGHVRSQSEGVQDITAEYDSAERTLKLRRARTQQLEKQLAEATDDASRASIKSKLRRAQIAERQATRGARSTRWRSNYVPVDVRLGVDSNADAAGQSTIAKAFDRAGEILETLIAALIVILAVLLPVAAAVLAVWWAARRWRRGRSDRTLAEAAAQPE